MTSDNSFILNHTVTMDDLSADDEFITASQFEDATRTVVRTIGRNDCDVVFAGDGAKTNGKLVVLPAQAPDKLMTKKQYAVGQGFANHETLHNLCTDMDNWDNEMTRLKKSGKKLAMTCANAIEDVRIERAGAKMYEGMPNQISSTADYAAKKFMEEYLPKSPDIMQDFKRIGPLAITWVGRKRMGYDSPYMDKCIAGLDPDVLAKVNKWCDLIETIPTGANGYADFDQEASRKGSHEAIKWAERLAKEIEESEDDDEEGEGAGGEGEGDEGEPSYAGDGTPEVDMHDAVMELLSKNDGTNAYRPVTTCLDLIADRHSNIMSVRRKICRSDGAQLYGKMLSDLGTKTAVMKRKLERALVAMAEVDYVSGQRAGRLDIRRRSAQIMRGQENVYRRKMEGKEIDTAVMILCDLSGSMGGRINGKTKMELSAQTCAALAECFEKTGVELEIIGFSNCAGAHRDGFRPEVIDVYEKAYSAAGKTKGTGMFHRNEALNIYVFKDFEDSLRECRQQLGSLSQCAGGNNSDGDAIIIAAKRLQRSKAKKKILMVLSDGQPAHKKVSGDEHKYTKQAVEYVTTKQGITTIGVGIMDSSVKNYYKNWSVVNNLSDLDKAVMDNIARMILGENFKVDNADVNGMASAFKGARSA